MACHQTVEFIGCMVSEGVEWGKGREAYLHESEGVTNPSDLNGITFRDLAAHEDSAGSRIS